MATIMPDLGDGLVGMPSEMSANSAVTFCWSEHGLPLESLSSTRTCVGWLAVAECRPGPLTWHVYCCVNMSMKQREKGRDWVEGEKEERRFA